MKRNIILQIIACGACLALRPDLHAQGQGSFGDLFNNGILLAMGGGGGGGGGGCLTPHGGALTVSKLNAAVNLTDNQKAKIKAILDAEQVAIRGDRADGSLTREQRFAKYKADRDYANSRISTILTPQQQAKFAEL